MTAYEVYVIVRENLGIGTVLLVVVLSLIEFSKIKINPWSFIGNIFNRELRNKIEEQGHQIDGMKQDISDINTEVKENAAMNSRYRILRFDDEIRHEIVHTKEHYDQIVVDIDVYEGFCKRNPGFRNNMAFMAIANIRKNYESHNDNNSFL